MCKLILLSGCNKKVKLCNYYKCLLCTLVLGKCHIILIILTIYQKGQYQNNINTLFDLARHKCFVILRIKKNLPIIYIKFNFLHNSVLF